MFRRNTKLFEKITTELGKQPNEYDWIPGISNLEGTFVTERYKLIESIYTYDRAIVAFAYFLCEEKSYKNKIGNEYKDWRQVGYETLKDAYKELKLFFNRVQEGQENKKQPIFLPTLDYVINSKCLKPSEPYFLRLLSLKNKKIVPVFLKTTIRPLVKHRINSLKKTYKRIFKKKKNEKNERKLSEFEVFQNKINKHLKTHTLDAKDDQIYWIPNLKRLKNKFPRAA